MLALMILVSAWGTADRIEAVVGDYPILRSEIYDRLAATAEALSRPVPGDSASFAVALSEIVEERLLVEGARDAGFFPGPEAVAAMVDGRIEEMREEFGSEQQYLSALAEAGLSEDELRLQLSDLMGEQRAVSDFVQSKTSKLLETLPADPVSYLNSNLDILEEELMPRNLSWILIPVLPGGPEADSALVFLAGLADRISAGESFDDLAVQYSQDPGSAAEGGFLGQFGPGDMTPTFVAALDALEPGGMSRPFLSPYGAHLARLDSRDSTGMMTASHILILLDLEQDDADRAGSLADSVASLVRSGAVAFGEAALRWSVDPLSSRDGGALGIVLVENSIPEAAGLLASSSPGSISGPVLLGDASAYAIIRDDGAAQGFDWTGFERDWLDDLVRNVVYTHGLNSLVDSLRMAVPVIYTRDAD